MDAAEYRDYMRQLGTFAVALSVVPIDEILEAIERMHAIAPIIDPTMYMAKADAMNEDKKLFEAARPLILFGRKLLADVRAGERPASDIL